MYKPPIEIISTDNILADIGEKTDKAIMLEITKQFDVHVDKYELTRALAYDRGQYDKGYKDGYDDALRQFTDFMKEKFGLYMVRSAEEVAELRKTHPNLFCLVGKKED